MFTCRSNTLRLLMPFYQNDSSGGGGEADTKAKAEAEAKEKTDADAKKSQKSFDAWLESQSAEIKELYTAHVGDLKGALQKERTANKDSAKALKRLEELETKEQERLDAQKSELEKAKDAQLKAEKEREAAQSELVTERRKNAVIAAANRLGFADPDDAYTLADLSEIENKEGKWKGIDEALKALAEAKPYLISKNGKSGDGLGNNLRKEKEKKTESKAEQKRPLVTL